MLQYERIDVSEEIDFNRSNKLKECIICHYWYFKDIDYIYQPHVCNGCQCLSLHVCNDLSILVYDRNDFTI